MMFVEIEGPLDSLRDLARVKGVELQAGVHDLGGGTWRASAYITSNAALDEVHARGLTVKITMDEDEVTRRVDKDREMMKDAIQDAGGDGDAGRKP